MRDTIDMAETISHGWWLDDEKLKAFEALVRADEREQGQKWFDAVTAQHKQEILAEREACAKVCDDIHDEHEARDTFSTYADAIRNRGNT